MKKYLKFAIFLVAIAASGCHKIYYHNGGQAVANKAAAQYNDWHHDGVLGLVEFSEPINLKARCEKGWDAVETENSFLTGLVSVFTYGLYTPREANIVCKR
jgi:hypothetical protein